MRAYLTVPVYARVPRVARARTAAGRDAGRLEAGDRKRALAAIPDAVVDELIIHGPPEACREHIARYVENGVDTPVLQLMGADDPRAAMRALAPR